MVLKSNAKYMTNIFQRQLSNIMIELPARDLASAAQRAFCKA